MVDGFWTLQCPRCGAYIIEPDCESCKDRTEYYKCGCGGYVQNPEYKGEATPLNLMSPQLKQSLELGKIGR
jgi:hypothetical protein